MRLVCLVLDHLDGCVIHRAVSSCIDKMEKTDDVQNHWAGAGVIGHAERDLFEPGE